MQLYNIPNSIVFNPTHAKDSTGVRTLNSPAGIYNGVVYIQANSNSNYISNNLLTILGTNSNSTYLVAIPCTNKSRYVIYTQFITITDTDNLVILGSNTLGISVTNQSTSNLLSITYPKGFRFKSIIGTTVEQSILSSA